MISLMNRSIDLIEELARESNNRFHLNRRGYLYATAERGRINEFKQTAKRAEAQGAGPVRIHTGDHQDPTYDPHQESGFEDQPDGCDLILATELIQEHFPYLSPNTVALLHTRRCGWFSGHQFGMLLYERAIQAGVEFINARVEGISLRDDKVDRIHVDQGGETLRISTKIFVNAAGPYLKHVGDMMGITLPTFCERHLKVSIGDIEDVIPRDAPLLIWEDPQRLAWDLEEEHLLSERDQDRILLQVLPPGAHLRPEGGRDSKQILMLWPYHLVPIEPVFPVPSPPEYPEVVLRGLTVMVPGLRTYTRRMPQPFVDGGYYTKTPENRLLAGPLPMEGAYILGALSGYGLMAACGAADLLYAYIAQEPLPEYASAFRLQRYTNPEYLRAFKGCEAAGQL
jgi:glycine/D-amino acid oxidase-like deaminating enzyme